GRAHDTEHDVTGRERTTAAQGGRLGQPQLLADGLGHGRGADGGQQVGHHTASRIATTPWPPAAQIEIRAREPGPFSASSLAVVATIRPPVAANGWPAASEDPWTLSL